MNILSMRMEFSYVQEEFAPYATLRGSATGVVARAVVEPGRDIESLRGRMPPSGIISEAGRQVNGLFESLLLEAFNA